MRECRASASIDMVHILMRYASGMGIDPAFAAATIGPALNDPGTRIPIKQLALVWRDAVQRSGDPNFGLHLGEAADALSPGSILFTVMLNCAIVESALKKLARYHALVTDFVQLHLHRHGDRAFYTWETVDTEMPPDRHYTEAVICNLVFSLRRLTQDNVQPVEIHFTHACPEDLAEHRRILACPLVFGCPENGLILLCKDLARPVFLANARLLEKMEQFAQESLARLYPPDTWSDRVAHLIQEGLLRGERPTLAIAANVLAFSPRQLQNKLKEEGNTYQYLLDRIRKETALRYLKEPQVTLCDLAFLLGFSEQSAFNRAFKRWTGTSPGAWAAGNAGAS